MSSKLQPWHSASLLCAYLCPCMHVWWMVLFLCVRCCQKVEEQWIRRMSEQQSAPEQLAAGKSQGGAGATYKVLEQPDERRISPWFIFKQAHFDVRLLVTDLLIWWTSQLFLSKLRLSRLPSQQFIKILLYTEAVLLSSRGKLKWVCVRLWIANLSVIQVVLFEFENFQGCKAEFSAECKDVTEKGLQKVGSVIIESGP